MAMLIQANVNCDHPGCTASVSVYVAVATDGRIVKHGEPKGWAVGENPVENIRRLYSLCPEHNPIDKVQEGINEAVKSVINQPLSVESMAKVHSVIEAALNTLKDQGLLPQIGVSDIKVETDGTISVSINDTRGPVRPDSPSKVEK